LAAFPSNTFFNFLAVQAPSRPSPAATPTGSVGPQRRRLRAAVCRL
jgi:hypothetical protein